MLLNFEELVDALRKKGFEVNVRIESGGDIEFAVASVTGNGIRGAFSEYNVDFNPNISNRFSADNAKCFDKISRCPLAMNLPLDLDVLMKHLTHLGSKEGYRISNNYLYLENNPYPYDIETD